ncbi:MAG: diaminobutyrate--2-oxoglutarate transaminase [Nitrospira sp.]|nr:diaminobutyrate--2-oxoglutarate transaminase [Nitrospira sp.]
MIVPFDETWRDLPTAVDTSCDELEADPYLERQVARESNARSYPRRLPVALRKGTGIYVQDTKDHTYIDCLAGAGALALGHNHPVVVNAIQQALHEKLPFQTLDLTTPVKDEFIKRLLMCLPESFAGDARIQFCGPSGADATEAAVKLVKTATGRRTILSFHGGYHGMTNGALSLTGCLSPKEAVPGLMADVHFLPFPYEYRCPFGTGGEEGQRLSSRYIERLLDDPNSGIVMPAAMIVEVVQGEGGVIPAPDDWLREIRRITSERKIPLIIDEVQTGLGRTGALFGFERAGIIPDVLLLSKAIGGGLPLSVVLYKSELDRWSAGAHAGTFRGNQLAMAAGIATMKFIQENGLDQHAAAMGERLVERLRQMQRECPIVGDIRGRGLMIGVEIVDPFAEPDHRGIYPADAAMARNIQAQALRRGLIVELGGRHDVVVRFLPPLIVTAEEIDMIASIFADAIKSAQRALV